MSETPRFARFGVFELDLQSGDLRRAGMRVRLSGQPLAILVQLVQRPGDLVTREELRRELWSDDTFVDFERNLNSAVKRLRAALGDSAIVPRFIETVPRRGYRLLQPVQTASIEIASAVAPMPSPDAVLPEARRRADGPGWVESRAAVAAAAILLVALGTITGAAFWSWKAASPVRVLAVVPFVALPTNDGGVDEYLSFGLTDAITTEISRLGGVAVISHAATPGRTGARTSRQQMARDLGVDAVVEGSLMKEGSRVRVNVQLIDARTGTHLWGAAYEREVGRAFPVFRDVAGKVAREVHVKLAPALAGTPGPDGPVDRSVYDSYLSGRHHLAKGTEADFLKAREHFERAVATDPTHAPSHAGLADYYVLTDTIAPRVAFPRARIHASQALALDESLADAHVSLAFVHYYGDWAWDAAEREFTRALELDPNHPRGRRWFGLLFAAIGRHDDARLQVERALAAEASMVNYDAAAAVSFNARAYDDVLAHAQKLQELDPKDPRGFEHQSLGAMQKGDYARALESADQGLSFSPDNTALRVVRAICLARLGRVAEAADALHDLENDPKSRYVPPTFVAAIATALGQHGRALDVLEGGYVTRDAYMVLLKTSPLFDAIRDTPRFLRLVGQMKFPD